MDHSARVPHTLHRPLEPMTPMQAPSGHSSRSSSAGGSSLDSSDLSSWSVEAGSESLSASASLPSSWLGVELVVAGARDPLDADLPHSAHWPSDPMTPMQAPSGHSSRRSGSKSSPSTSRGPAGVDFSAAMAVGKAAVGGGASSLDTLRPAEGVFFADPLPHSAHRPSSPMTPMHAPSGQSSRSLGSNPVCRGSCVMAFYFRFLKISSSLDLASSAELSFFGASSRETKLKC